MQHSLATLRSSLSASHGSGAFIIKPKGTMLAFCLKSNTKLWWDNVSSSEYFFECERSWKIDMWKTKQYSRSICTSGEEVKQRQRCGTHNLRNHMRCTPVAAVHHTLRFLCDFIMQREAVLHWQVHTKVHQKKKKEHFWQPLCSKPFEVIKQSCIQQRRSNITVLSSCCDTFSCRPPQLSKKCLSKSL